MKSKAIIILTTAVLAIVVTLLWAVGLAGAGPLARPNLQGGAPTVVSYQGQVKVDGVAYDGVGYFKFAIVNQAGTITYWSNDGTSAVGGEPTNAVSLVVSEGLFSVLLGDATLDGMTQALEAAVFSGTDRYLRVWFSQAGAVGTFTQLIPDRRIAAVPYALQAEWAKNADETDPVWTAASGNYYTKANLQTTGQSQVHWNNLTNRPPGLDDGDDVGITSETDPTVLASVKDGVDCSEVQNATGIYMDYRPNDTACGANQVLKYDDGNARWVCADDSGVGAETDPVYSAAPASGIAAADITNWNTAYGWGDHSTQGYLTSYTETDPVFGASPSAGIAATDITNWDTAHGWGDHSTQGYLTSYTETDPVYSADPASGIAAADITNWDTAHGWGDHSTQGYLTSYTETDPVYSADPASGIAAADITNWNTAYGWGDHSGQGYLTSEVDGDTSNELQNLFATVTGDTGTTTADAQTDTLNVVGSGGVATAISGDTLTITGSGGGDVKQLIQDFVVGAGESVTAGDVVSFLNGAVKKGLAGSEYVFNSGYIFHASAAALSSTKFVVAYRDGSNDSGTAIVGDVSGTAITYGSEVVFNSAVTDYISAAALSSTKFVVAYAEGGSLHYTGTAIVGDVSGTTITYGSEVVFNSGLYPLTDNISAAALSSTKFVVAYTDVGNSSYGTAIVGDVSDTTITYGSEYVFNSAATYYISAAALSSTKFVVAYMGGGNGYGTAIVGNVVSGNTITYSLKVVFNSAETYFISAAALSSTKFVVAYMDGGNSDYGTAIVGGASSTNISYGIEHVFNSADTYSISAAALSSTQFVVAYQDSGIGYGKAIVGDVVSNDYITYGSEYVFNSAGIGYVSAAALSSTKYVVAYRDWGNSSYGTAVIGESFPVAEAVGIAKESKTAGQTVPVIIGGVSDVHSGLTAGQTYYSDLVGDLTTTATDWRVGLAVSASEILLNSDSDNALQFFGDLVFANNFRITEASSYEGLILKNQLNQEILTVSEVGALSAQGDLNVGGYVQLDTVSSAPPPADCDEASEEGRMKVDPSSELLYICVSSGWVTK